MKPHEQAALVKSFKKAVSDTALERGVTRQQVVREMREYLKNHQERRDKELSEYEIP